MLRAVIFDMDGVIADTEPLHARAYIQVFKTYGIHISKDQYREAITVDGKTTAAWFVELGGGADQIAELYRKKDQIYLPLLKERVAPRPGLVKLLAELKASGIPCALATSARKLSAEFVIQLLGLGDFFTVVLGFEDVGRAKPDPEVFLLALKRLNVRPYNTVVLEDAPKGVRAAAEAGIPVVAVPTEWTRHYPFEKAALIVDSMEELSVSRLAALLPKPPPD